MSVPKEIVPGLWHWTTVHPDIKVRVHSYLAEREKVVLDPLLPSGGIGWLRRHGPPEHVVLTTGLHSRHSLQIAEAFDCPVWVPRPGLRRLKPELRAHARGYVTGDRLPGGLRAFGIGVLCPDEFARPPPEAEGGGGGGRRRPAHAGTTSGGKGQLMFLPDRYLVDDLKKAPRVKRGLRKAYGRLAKRRWDHLLMAHGEPWLRDGRDALRAFAEAEA